MIRQLKAEVCVQGSDIVGESPVWIEAANSLYWVDIRGKAVRRMTLGCSAVESWSMPDFVGCIVPTRGDRFLLGLTPQLSLWCPQTGDLFALDTAHIDCSVNRFNEGKSDPHGRLWVGTMNASQRLPSGALYRFQSDVGFISVRNKVVVPNGLSWDPSGRFMFFTDSWVGDVLRFPYGSEGGLGQPEVFFATGAAPGQPDGATFDVDGCMWSARFGAGQVVRIMPNGTIDTIVHVPTDQVTSCTFGGVSRELLFITTATALLGEEAQAAQPLAGSLFIANVGTQGLPDARLDT